MNGHLSFIGNPNTVRLDSLSTLQGKEMLSSIFHSRSSVIHIRCRFYCTTFVKSTVPGHHCLLLYQKSSIRPLEGTPKVTLHICHLTKPKYHFVLSLQLIPFLRGQTPALTESYTFLHTVTSASRVVHCAMPNNQNSSSQSSAALDPKTRQAINKHLCEPNAAKMLTDAGRASQQARNVGGRK